MSDELRAAERLLKYANDGLLEYDMEDHDDPELKQHYSDCGCKACEKIRSEWNKPVGKSRPLVSPEPRDRRVKMGVAE